MKYAPRSAPIVDLTTIRARRHSTVFMDKKAKKKQDVLRHRLQVLQQQLSGARRQLDDPEEVRRLEQDIATTESELQKFK